jgi:hypothetical protein
MPRKKKPCHPELVEGPPISLRHLPQVPSNSGISRGFPATRSPLSSSRDRFFPTHPFHPRKFQSARSVSLSRRAQSPACPEKKPVTLSLSKGLQYLSGIFRRFPATRSPLSSSRDRFFPTHPFHPRKFQSARSISLSRRAQSAACLEKKSPVTLSLSKGLQYLSGIFRGFPATHSPLSSSGDRLFPTHPFHPRNFSRIPSTELTPPPIRSALSQRHSPFLPST